MKGFFIGLLVGFVLAGSFGYAQYGGEGGFWQDQQGNVGTYYNWPNGTQFNDMRGNSTTIYKAPGFQSFGNKNPC